MVSYIGLKRITAHFGIVISMYTLLGSIQPVKAQFYSQTNLVSDIPGMANHLDPFLSNPWGISFSPTSPIWISDNHTGLTTLYNGAGTPFALVVTIPPPSGGSSPSAPTGQVFSPFASSGAFQKDTFIFATEDGTISGWHGTIGFNAVLHVDNSGTGAVYKGLAIGSVGANHYIYAANFNSGNVDVFDQNYTPATLTGSFMDPSLPAGYAPFGISNIGGQIYVTYDVQDGAKHDDVSGAGNGIVDVYTTDGVFIQRLISPSSSPLNSPWGLALAPADFGPFSNDLLIGNFGDGMINAFNSTGAFQGSLMSNPTTPISIEGLWGLAFGNGAQGTKTNSLYFTAGISGGANVEDHGLFGSLQQVPEPSSLGFLCSLIAPGMLLIRQRYKN